MPFAALIGNERVRRLLMRSVSENRIAQGLLFAGPRGVGKYQFALSLAQALNCERPTSGDACGTCIPCRKIQLSGHLDVETFKPDGQFIKVDQMRDMSEKAQYRPYEGRRRVYIIDEADRLRLEAANSILKTLEEPPECTVLILVTSKPYALIETIRSRCQMINFAPLNRPELESQLGSSGKRDAQDVKLLARLAQGSIGHALEIDLEGYKQVRGKMLDLLDALVPAPDVIRVLGAAEFLGRKLEREEFEKHLDVLLVLLQDVVYLKVGEVEDLITNADVNPRLSKLAETITMARISELADGIETVLRDLVRNVNRQLAMERVLIA
jgi:DNA polymerase-3 subunit delta'